MRLCFFLLVFACDRPPPGNLAGVPTAKLGIDLDVKSNGAEMLVQAKTFELGSHEGRALGPADSLVVRVPGAPEAVLSPYVTMNLSRDQIGYAAFVAPAADTLTFLVMRGGASASETTVVLPSSFEVVAPTSPSRAAPITLTWTANAVDGVAMAITVTAPCLPAPVVKDLDSKSTSFQLLPSEFTATTGGCTLGVGVTRRTFVTATPLTNLPESSVFLQQQRLLSIETVP